MAYLEKDVVTARDYQTGEVTRKEDIYAFRLIDKSGKETELSYFDAAWYAEVPPYVTPSRLSAFPQNFMCRNGIIVIDYQAFFADGTTVELKGFETTAYKLYYSFDGVRATDKYMSVMYSNQYDMFDYGGDLLVDYKGNVVMNLPSTTYWDTKLLSCYGYDVMFVPSGDGLMAVSWDDDPMAYDNVSKYGLMDMDGNWVIEPAYDGFSADSHGNYIKDGLWVVKKDGKYGAVDTRGNTVIPFKYYYLSTFCGGFAIASTSNDGQAFYIDRSGKEYKIGAPGGGTAKIESSYYLTEFNEDGVAAVTDESGRSYYISNRPVNGVLPVVKGSENIPQDAITHTSGFGSVDEAVLTFEIATDVPFKSNGKYGLMHIDFSKQSFTDVPATSPYYEAITWATDNGYINGVSADRYAPDTPVNRGMMATILWNINDKPQVSSGTNFTDVKSGAYYDSAIKWAVSKTIISGINTTTFAPENPCNAGMVLMLIHNSLDKPLPSSTENVFSKVSPTDYYYTALLWAYEKGVIGADFDPKVICTRATMIDYFYKILADN